MIPALKQRVRVVGLPDIYVVVNVDFAASVVVLTRINSDPTHEVLTARFDQIVPAGPTPALN